VLVFLISHLQCFTMGKKSHGIHRPTGQAKKHARTKAHQDQDPQKIKAAIKRDLSEFFLYYLLHIRCHISGFSNLSYQKISIQLPLN
jgi:hypothetical protein